MTVTELTNTVNEQKDQLASLTNEMTSVKTSVGNIELTLDAFPNTVEAAVETAFEDVPTMAQFKDLQKDQEETLSLVRTDCQASHEPLSHH